MQTRIRSLITAAVAGCLLIGLTATASAAADPTGEWTWTMTRPGGGTGTGTPRVTTLKLELKGGKLTGTVTNPGRQGADPTKTDIKDGKMEGDKISFSVTREFGGNTMTAKYSGTVTADTIKGKIETERDGETQSRDWTATKKK